MRGRDEEVVMSETNTKSKEEGAKARYKTQMKGNSLCCCLSPSSASKSLSSDEIFS